MNIFLTGDVGIGKSTILNNILDEFFSERKVGGFKTLPLIKEDGFYGYYMTTTMFGESRSNGNDLVGINNSVEGKKKCIGVMETFETIGVEIMEKSLEGNLDIIFMDELGFFESDAEKFQNIIHKALDSKIDVLGVLKKRDTTFLNSIRDRDDTHIFEVKVENRDYLKQKIVKLGGYDIERF